MNPFGRYLRIHRVAAELSLRHVADQLGVSHVFLGEVERGVKRKLPEKYWKKLTEVVPGVTIEGLEEAAQASGSLDTRVKAMRNAEQGLVYALARRIEADELPSKKMQELRRILALDDEEE
ncbi:MAG: helix-turn-helix transcriptional regulator [Thermoanaerobaculia bacterium]|jgi:transcriptional regulator with XRE-family HTH domain